MSTNETAEAIRKMMAIWDHFAEEVREGYCEMDDEQRYELLAAIFERALGIRREDL